MVENHPRWSTVVHRAMVCFKLFVLIAVVSLDIVFSTNPCETKQEVCNSQPSDPARIKWYFDVDLFVCLAYCEDPSLQAQVIAGYTYDGCSQCRPPDGRTCGAPNSQNGTCEDSGEPGASTCQQGFECKHGMFAACCNSTAEALWEQEYSSPECPDGQTVYKIVESHDRDVVVRGKSCVDNFCPQGMSCSSGEFLSWCCRDDDK